MFIDPFPLQANMVGKKKWFFRTHFGEAGVLFGGEKCLPTPLELAKAVPLVFSFKLLMLLREAFL